jgi:hypothetical protein
MNIVLPPLSNIMQLFEKRAMRVRMGDLKLKNFGVLD